MGFCLRTRKVINNSCIRVFVSGKRVMFVEERARTPLCAADATTRSAASHYDRRESLRTRDNVTAVITAIPSQRVNPGSERLSATKPRKPIRCRLSEETYSTRRGPRTQDAGRLNVSDRPVFAVTARLFSPIAKITRRTSEKYSARQIQCSPPPRPRPGTDF